MTHANANGTHNCGCPRCNSAGRSVAAMNYAETQHWDKKGTFSGSGVVIGTGGLGIGFGGGTYSERGTQKTKRADVFKEPEQYVKPVLGIIVCGMACMMLYSSNPDLMDRMGETNTGGSLHAFSAVYSNLMPTIISLTPIVGLLIVAIVVAKVWLNKREENRLNKDVWPKQVKRYNQLRYCENCNILFDSQGRSADGSELGFSEMMEHLD